MEIVRVLCTDVDDEFTGAEDSEEDDLGAWGDADDTGTSLDELRNSEEVV